MNKFKRLKQKGFTLLEVMVVIVILGVIAGLVVPNLMGNVEQANIDAAKIEITTIEKAMKMYKLRNNVYPTTEQGLEALVNQTDIEPIPRSFPDEGFLPDIPKDPWDNEYLLVSPGDNGTFDIYSFGPDLQPETDDDIGNWSTDEEQR